MRLRLPRLVHILLALILAVAILGELSAQSRGLPPPQSTTDDAEQDEADESEGADDGAVETESDVETEGDVETESNVETEGDVEAESAVETEGDVETASVEEELIEVPRGFQTLDLGMGLAEVKEALKADTNFNFRGDPDVTMLNNPNDSLIETEGFSFVDRAFFQFHEQKLYTIIIMLNPEEIDHFTMYTRLTDKYGEPSSLSPSEVVWDFDAIRLSLERPLAVKYVDKQVFESLLEAGDKAESFNEINKDNFLDQF